MAARRGLRDVRGVYFADDLTRNRARLAYLARGLKRNQSILDIKKLITLQKKVIRIICNAKRRTHSYPLFLQLGILKFTDINQYLTGKFLFKWYNQEVPSFFNEMFVLKRDVHTYHTRGFSCHLHVPLVKTNIGKQNIRYRGSVIWNSIIDLGISPNTSEFTFSRSLKKILLHQSD